MKKVLTAVTCAAMVCGLAACGGEKDTRTEVTYFGWNLGTPEQQSLQRKMIEEFNKTSETTRITIVERNADSYSAQLQALAAAKKLPDVFLSENVAADITKKYALELSELADADNEWTYVDDTLIESVTYNDQLFAIPTSMNYIGFLVNHDLVNDTYTGSGSSESIFSRGKFSINQLYKAVEDAKDIRGDGTSTIGINQTSDFINWMPSALDSTGQTQHFVYNSTTKSFGFRTDLMYNTLDRITELGDPTKQLTFNSFSNVKDDAGLNDRIKEFGTESAFDVFKNGQMAFHQQGTWLTNYESIDFNYEFIGFAEDKVIAATDFTCLSATLTDAKKEAAWEVAKYMSFGEDGYNTRFDIVDAAAETDSPIALQGLPVNTKTSLANEWFTHVGLNGVETVYNAVKNGWMDLLVEGNKTVPGFLTARFNYATGIEVDHRDNPLSIGDLIWDVCGGDISVADYKNYMTESLSNAINAEIKKAFDDLGLE